MRFFRYLAGGVLAAAMIVGAAAASSAAGFPSPDGSQVTAGSDWPSGIEYSIRWTDWNPHQDAWYPVQDVKGEF